MQPQSFNSLQRDGNRLGEGAAVREASTGYAELLRRNRDFRRLWLGQVVSQMGDWFNTIALYTIVLDLTGSGRAVGLVLVARFLPSVVVGPASGVLADRFSRRSIMIISDILRALVVLGFLLVKSAEQLWLVYVLTVMQLVCSTFFEPARTAAIPSIVAPRDLVAANAISSATWSAMLTLGAAIGGLITGWVGTDAAFILDSLTYILSAVLIMTVRLPRRGPPEAKKRLTLMSALGLTQTFEGMSYVKRRPRVFALLMVKPAWGLGGGILALLAVFGEKVFPMERTATGIGVLYAARGIGTAIGPFAARRFSGETRAYMQTAIGISFLISGLFYIAFGSATNFGLAIFVLAIAHTGGSILWVYSTVLLQQSVEDSFRGRVFAAELALLTLTMALSNYATGELLDRYQFSPRAVAVGFGVFFLLPGLIWLVTMRLWNKEEDAERV